MRPYIVPDGLIIKAYEELAAAIVRAAAEDYEEALTDILTAETRAARAHAIARKREAESFFLGEWYHALCGLDQRAVIEAIERRVIRQELARSMDMLRTALERYEEGD